MAILPHYHVNHNKLPLPSHRPLPRVTTARTLASRPKTTGYAQVADFFSTDRELAVYRRFDRSVARVLLVLQSKILLKQNQLDKLDEQDAADPNDEKRFLASATIYEELPQPRDPRDEEKSQLCEDLREDLKEYYQLLTAQSEVLKFPSPPDRVKNVLAQFLDDEQCLVGLGEKAYIEDNRDLVALRPAKGDDRLSQFLRDHCSRWLKKDRDQSRQPWKKAYYLPETRIAKAVGVLSVIVAGGLMVGAIISLYFVTAPASRLGLLTMWTILFAFSVSVLSTASRSELFAATAAYAAVLVVFVSGNLASPSSIKTPTL